MDKKNKKIEKIKKTMLDMINDFEDDIMERDDGKETYLNFLDDVLEFYKLDSFKIYI
ncbi:hypothetical protein [Natronospora cellulosivora (SeqCode)]